MNDHGHATTTRPLVKLGADHPFSRVYGTVHRYVFDHFPPYQRLRDEILATVESVVGDGVKRRDIRILDLACGPGDMAFALAEAGYSVFGVEPFGVLVQLARERGRVLGLTNVTFERTPLGDTPFDVVLNVHTLYAHPGWKDLLRMAHDALAPGGHAVFVNFSRPLPMWASFGSVARRAGMSAAARSLLWLLPNALFETARASGESNYWDEAAFAERLGGVGFDVVSMRRTFFEEASLLAVARKSPAPTVARPVAAEPALEAPPTMWPAIRETAAEPERQAARPPARRALARLVAYEVAESLRFQAPASEGGGAWLRDAQATLLGRDVLPFREGTPFAAGSYAVIRARSSVDLTTWQGSVEGDFDLLEDSDPTRQALDKLVVSRCGTLSGTLDLAPATRGFAVVEGRWSLADRTAAGPFRCVFLIPFTRAGHEGHWYVEHEPDGSPREDEPGFVPVRPCEQLLDIPLTKAVITLFEPVPAAADDGRAAASGPARAAAAVVGRDFGELTHRTARSLCAAVESRLAAGVGDLHLALLDVKEIDVVGLAALLQCTQEAAARAVAVTVTPSPVLHRALLEADLLDTLPVGGPVPPPADATAARAHASRDDRPFLASTDRLALRQPTPEELRLFDAWARERFLDRMVGSKLLSRCRHLGASHPEFAALVLNDPTSLTLVVEPLGRAHPPVGFLRLYDVDLVQRFAFLESVIADPRFLRKGWGVEATRLLLAYGVDVLGLRRVEAKVYAYNALSGNSLKRGGFRLDGVLRQARAYEDQRWDINVFSILDDEMAEQRKKEAFPYMGFWARGERPPALVARA
jgi:RimJ/RimL family protein N-acetyltransferase/SAM-dependent methyltransferase/ABC-type transporter Mla MlaB component